LRFGCRGQTISRRAGSDDRLHLVPINKHPGDAGSLFGASLVVLNDNVDLVAMDSAGLIDFIGSHQHAVLR
jgi:hypothetical protein